MPANICNSGESTEQKIKAECLGYLTLLRNVNCQQAPPTHAAEFHVLIRTKAQLPSLTFIFPLVERRGQEMRCCKRKFMFPSNLNYCNASSLLPASWKKSRTIKSFLAVRKLCRKNIMIIIRNSAVYPLTSSLSLLAFYF